MEDTWWPPMVYLTRMLSSKCMYLHIVHPQEWPYHHAFTVVLNSDHGRLLSLIQKKI